jgi:MFS transporter, DHA2 family, multidrug resistance protein
METSGEFGVALGVAMMGSLGTYVYRSQLSGSIPSGLTPATANTALESIPAALAVARELPTPLGAALLDAANTAYASGLNTVAAVGVIIFVALALLAVAALRRTDAASAEPALAAA